MDHRLRRGVIESIRSSTLLGAFAAVSLLLSALALYALVSYSTERRIREFAIRGALGMPPTAVVWLAMQAGLRPLVAGGSLGVAVTLLLAALVPQVRRFDAIFAVSILALTLIGCIASLVPALRAVRTSTLDALKFE